jgi:hypothetical protein
MALCVALCGNGADFAAWIMHFQIMMKEKQRSAFLKVTIYLKYQLAPTCFGASGASYSGSPK